jgi:hypothetical protein
MTLVFFSMAGIQETVRIGNQAALIGNHALIENADLLAGEA